MANLLQILGLAAAPAAAFGTSAQQIRPIQSIDPNTGLPVSGPIINGVIPPAAPEAPQASAPVNLLEGTPYDQSNVLQAIGGSPDAPQPAPVPQAPQAQPAAAPAEAPRQRRSLLDTVGRISDVLARVGGAEALYQPTLDAREDRANALADRQRGIDLDALRRTLVEQQIAAGGDEATARGNAMLGAAVRGLQAIKARGGDIAAAWPILARQAGIPEEQASALGQIFAQNPQAVEAIAAMTVQKREFGMQPFYAQGPDGQLRAYQLGRDGTIQPIQLGEGEVPIDPLKFVDTGGAQVGVGTRSGSVRRILPNSVDPNTRANIGSRERIAAAGNASRERVAATRGAGKQGASNPAQVAAGAAPVVSALRDAITRLHNSGGMTDENSGALGIANAIARENVPGYERFTNSEGFSAREDLNRLLTVGIPSLLPLMGGLTLGGKNIDAAKELDTWRQAIASAKDYPSAMRAVQGFERRIAELSAGDPASAAAPAQGGNAAAIAEARRRGLIP